jgi:hypothetical protein
MPYSPEASNRLIVEEQKKLSKQMSICQKVYMTLTSEGWRDIIEPLIDRMIIDVAGGKIGDTWVSGKLDKARTDERREFYIGYKQALIDLLGRAKFHITQLPLLEEKMKQLSSDLNPKFRQPMVEDTRYAPEGK